MSDPVKLFSIPNPAALTAALPPARDPLTLVYTPAAVGSPFSVLTFDGHDDATPVDGITRGLERSWVMSRAALENVLNLASGAITGYSSGLGQLTLELESGERFDFGTAPAPVAQPTAAVAPSTASAPVVIPSVFAPDNDPMSALLCTRILSALRLGALTHYRDLGLPEFTVSAPTKAVTFRLDLDHTWITIVQAGKSETRPYTRLAYTDYNRVRFAVRDQWNNQKGTCS